MQRPLAATVNCDASFCPHTKAAGWAVWIAVDGGVKHKQSGRFKHSPRTSNEAEFWAMLNGLWIAVHTYGVTHALIQGDCRGALDKIMRRPVVVRNICDKVDHAVSIRTKWVKAHTTTSDARSWVNDWCDRQAKRHMESERRTKRKNKTK